MRVQTLPKRFWPPPRMKPDSREKFVLRKSSAFSCYRTVFLGQAPSGFAVAPYGPVATPAAPATVRQPRISSTTTAYFAHTPARPLERLKQPPLDNADIHVARLRRPLSVALNHLGCRFARMESGCVSYAETAVIDSILNLLFRGAHSRLTRPFSPVSLHGASQGGAILVCIGSSHMT